MARSRAIFELAAIEREFHEKKAQLDLRQALSSLADVRTLSEAKVQSANAGSAHGGLPADVRHEHERLKFDERGTVRHAELRRALNGESPAPASLGSLLHLCGLGSDVRGGAPTSITRDFAELLLATLAHELKRRGSEPVETATVLPETRDRLDVVAPELTLGRRPRWQATFRSWLDYVEARPRSTVISYATPWKDLQRFAAKNGVSSPATVTPALMSAFVGDLRARGLAVRTINERISKIRSIYKIAVGRFVVTHNPAAHTLGMKESGVRKRRKRRLSFDVQDLTAIFGSPIFIHHERSEGQSGEATYWIPLLMFYTGARPEEVAGLALRDLREDPAHGWYFNLVDRPSSEDYELFKPDDVEVAENSEEAAPYDEDEFESTDDTSGDVPETHRRTLKNGASIRRVPVAQELIDLGLLRYVDWLRAHNHIVFFPTLVKDWHGKLSGSFGKFFGRYKRDVGIVDSRKVLYSFRHLMKDLLEQAGVPSKYLKRILGHTSGDGSVTDGYGSELPWRRMVVYFRRITFPQIPASPWEPGRGFYRSPRR